MESMVEKKEQEDYNWFNSTISFLRFIFCVMLTLCGCTVVFTSGTDIVKITIGMIAIIIGVFK